ncbi:HNH endonuclease [Geodermatophilus sp. YIM 151500]|uniref:HNH endonuclease signature motif containing protein n=1 Tax=Geodermatophilus sp. YIM 151500 TaxID=2984531 RepID=UPI0021E41994|nr:HNH endonuclease signature motif containing protein [Geodermatophilus sp. YIM 151500]MCV2488693.1 HNH endonuclease [Geodermatophilus sp. YIM 151500]
MGELQSALDALAADDLHVMFGPQLLERAAQLLAARNRLDAELTRTIREADLTSAAEFDGLATMQSWLRGRGHAAPGTAARLVRHGRALEHLPALTAAHAAGAVTTDQVDVVAPIADQARRTATAAQGVDLGEVDRTLAALAAEGSVARLRAAVGHYLARLDTDGPEPDPTEGRALSIAGYGAGSVLIRGQLDAVGGEKLLAALESIVQANRPQGDRRTRAQQLADALVQLADKQLAAGDLPILRTVKPTVVVTVPAADFLDPTTGPGAATTAFGSPLSAAGARRLACDGSVLRVLLDPDGLPLDVGRTRRVVPPHIRKAVELRDRACVFAGCAAPKHWCDVHHLIEWVLGGVTSVGNSALLCERHHTKVHHGFRVQRDPGGRWRTYRPDGTEITLSPPLLV